MRPNPTIPSCMGSTLLPRRLPDSLRPMARARKADVLVIFGITGDLAKKMTFRALYRLEARKRLDTRIIGVARNDWNDANLVEHVRSSLKHTRVDIDEAVF